MTLAVETKQETLQTLRRNGRRITSFGIKRLGLFGSIVRGEQEHDSDVDLLVEFEEGKKSFDNFMNLAFFLEEILNRKVELVTTDALSPYIGRYILEEVEDVNLSD